MSFMVLSSIVIPYSAHTCMISEQTNIQFMSMQDECNMYAVNSHQNNVPEINKSSCCLVDNGLIDIDIELVFSNLNSFLAFTPSERFTFKLPQQLKLKQKKKFFMLLIIGKGFQSGLCSNLSFASF